MTGNAVAKANQGTAVAAADNAPLAHQIEAMKERFAKSLPPHLPVERFVRFSLLAMSNKQVAQAAETPEGRRSVFDSLLKCASDGLMPDGREAALVAYRTKTDNGWATTVQYQSMVAGILKKARNSGEISNIACQVVYENDKFTISFVTDGPPITHEPALDNRGAMIGAYAVCRFKDGTWSQPEWMTKAQIDDIMKRSKSKDKEGNVTGPWKTDYSEMARKTVIRRASKSWPSSTDKEGRDIGDIIRAGDDLEIEHEAVLPAIEGQGRKKPRAAELLKPAEAKQPPPSDDDEGEDEGGGRGWDEDGDV